MSDEIAFRYRAGAPGIAGIPRRDLTAAEVAAMPPDRRRAVKRLAAYDPVATETTDDPLHSLSNEDYAALTPAQKAARTREANKRAEEAATTEEGED